MSLDNFIPEIWSGELLVAFRKAHVFAPLVNRQYEGDVRDKGDVVRITTPAPIAVNAYSGTVTYETPLSAQQSLLIDQDFYWAFDMDDLEKVQANVELMRPFMEEAGYALADTVDTNIAALYTASGLSDTALTIATAADNYPAYVTAAQKLDEANVPRTGRWVVISPAGYGALLKTAQFTAATQLGDAVIRTGAVGQVAGFNVYVSNNLVLDTTRKYMYGTNSAITFALQHSMVEPVRREGSFKDAVRGRHVWGRKVVRPSALGVISATE